MDFDLDFDLDLDLDFLQEEKKEKPKEKQENKEEKHVVSYKYGKRHLTRKASSEKALEESLDWHFQDGDCYHCFSFGDVDSMSYLKHVLKQQKINYLALSTWCMAGEDVIDLEKWHDMGMLGRVDFFVGEIFKGSYPLVYELTEKFVKKCGGRLVVFRNHSKIMMIKGERFDCLIESSANINTNPRCENTVLTVDKNLVNDYIKLFGEIIPFNKDGFVGAEPYQIER